MKKVFQSWGLKSLVMALFVMVSVCVSTSASAQTLTGQGAAGSSPIKINGTWLSNTDALDAVQAEVIALDQFLANNNPSNAAAIKMKYTIYQGIVVSLENGVSVGQSAYDNYYSYAPGTVDSTPVNFEISTADWQNIYTDMINLLTL